MLYCRYSFVQSCRWQTMLHCRISFTQSCQCQAMLHCRSVSTQSCQDADLCNFGLRREKRLQWCIFGSHIIHMGSLAFLWLCNSRRRSYHIAHCIQITTASAMSLCVLLGVHCSSMLIASTSCQDIAAPCLLITGRLDLVTE